MVLIKRLFFRALFHVALLLLIMQIVACDRKSSPDELAKDILAQASSLLQTRDKIATQSTKISHTKKEGIAVISTEEVDSFVKKRLDTWIKVANDLESFHNTYPSSEFSKDAIFTAVLLWTSISQADRQYSKKTITVCKNALSGKLQCKLK